MGLVLSSNTCSPHSFPILMVNFEKSSIVNVCPVPEVGDETVSWPSALGADFSDSSDEPDHSYDHLSTTPHPYLGGHAIKAEVKLFVRARDSGKEAVEIRSIREFVDLTDMPTSPFENPRVPLPHDTFPRGSRAHHALKSQARGNCSGSGTKSIRILHLRKTFAFG